MSDGSPLYPVSSFVVPVPVPGVDPDAGGQVQVCFSAVWLPYILGALQQLTLPTTWQGDDAVVLAAVERSELLLSIFGQAKMCCERKFAWLCNLAGQDVPHNVTTQVLWDSVQENTGGYTWNFMQPGDLSIDEPGVYTAYCQVRINDSGAGDRRDIQVQFGGVLIAWSVVPPVPGISVLSVTAVFEVTTPGILRVYAYQNSGATLSMAGGNSNRNTHIRIEKIKD